MYEYTIIGGGIHGVLFAHWLTNYKFADHEKVCILDPNKTPLYCWRTRTGSVGMTHLRSPSVHHIGTEPFELHKLSKKNPNIAKYPFAEPYARPSLDLFERHVSDIIESNKIESMWKVGSAQKIVKDGNSYIISTEEEEIKSKRVILALGASTKLTYPDWLTEEIIESNKVQHIFEKGFERDQIGNGEKVLVIGGGISGLQVATALSQELRNKVIIYSRHELRKHEFDSDPCWVGPKCMKKFNRVTSLAKRRKLITTARHKGSVSSESLLNFTRAARQGQISHRVRDIKKVELTPSGQLDTIAHGDKASETFDRILLATGFDTKRPGGELIDDLIESEGLKIADCGYPITGDDLCWHEGLYVMGALAELRMGPTARNIIGGRKAAERILEALQSA